MGKIVFGSLSGGGGGGVLPNPTNGIVPVKKAGIFVDSLIHSTDDNGNGTRIDINDVSQIIELISGNSGIKIDGSIDDITIDSGNVINLNGGVFINDHLGLQILRFLSNGSSHPAIKVNGSNLEIRNGNDTAFTSLKARVLESTNDTTIGTNANIGASAIVGSDVIFLTKSIIASIVNNNITLFNQAKTGFGLLQFGGITNAYPAIKRNGTGIDFRLADDSLFTSVTASQFGADGGVFTSGNPAIQLRIGTTPILRGGTGGIQVSANATAPNASAQFEIVSTSKGFLLPKMTALQRTAIASPAIGLMVYQTDGGTAEGIWTYKSAGWVQGV